MSCGILFRPPERKVPKYDSGWTYPEGHVYIKKIVKYPPLNDFSTTTSAAGIARWSWATLAIQLNSNLHSRRFDNLISSYSVLDLPRTNIHRISGPYKADSAYKEVCTIVPLPLKADVEGKKDMLLASWSQRFSMGTTLSAIAARLIRSTVVSVPKYNQG